MEFSVNFFRWFSTLLAVCLPFLMLACDKTSAYGIFADLDQDPKPLDGATNLFYYYDIEKYRVLKYSTAITWPEAYDYCRKYNLKLARIKSTNQVNKIMSTKLPPKGKSEFMWTAGRSRTGYEQLVWEQEDKVSPDFKVIGQWELTVPNLACLAFRNDKFSIRHCMDRGFTLCEDDFENKRRNS